jgi:hypothetical protein
MNELSLVTRARFYCAGKDPHPFISMLMTIDQFIALAASIGACLAAVATLLTVRQMAEQRKASYHPELALERILFEGSPDPIAQGPLPLFWVRKTDGAEPHIASRFAIPLVNIGLGAAKSVVASWSFPIQDMVDDLNERAKRTLTPALFAFEENGILSLNSEKLGTRASIWVNQKTETIDYVLPAAVQREPVMLQLPDAYILATSALLFLGFIDDRRESFPVVPPLQVTFAYLDIAGEKRQACFDIQLHVVAGGQNGSFIHCYLEPNKRT